MTQRQELHVGDWQPGWGKADGSCWVSLGAPSSAMGAGGAAFPLFREQGALVLSLWGCKQVKQWVSIRWKSSVVCVGCWNPKELIGKWACLSMVESPLLSVAGGIMVRCSDKGWSRIGTQLWALLSLEFGVPWVLQGDAYWFHPKTSSINCILSIEMYAKQPLFLFFLFAKSSFSTLYSLVCSYSKLVCTGVLKWEANSIRIS